jgi:magnesium transporter
VLSIRTARGGAVRRRRARCEREPELLKQGSGFVRCTPHGLGGDRYFPVLRPLRDRARRPGGADVHGRPRSGASRSCTGSSSGSRRSHAAGAAVDAVGRLHGGRVPRARARRSTTGTSSITCNASTSRSKAAAR